MGKADSSSLFKRKAEAPPGIIGILNINAHIFKLIHKAQMKLN